MPARYIPPGQPLYDKVRSIGENRYTRIPLSEWPADQIAQYIVSANNPPFPTEETKRDALALIEHLRQHRKLELERQQKDKERRAWLRQHPFAAYFKGIWDAIVWPVDELRDHLRTKGQLRQWPL